MSYSGYRKVVLVALRLPRQVPAEATILNPKKEMNAYRVSQEMS